MHLSLSTSNNYLDTEKETYIHFFIVQLRLIEERVENFILSSREINSKLDKGNILRFLKLEFTIPPGLVSSRKTPY